MVKLNISGKKYVVPQVSELSFSQFNNIFITNNVTDLMEYISLFVEIPLNELIGEGVNIKSVCPEAIHASIFNVDIVKALKDPDKTILIDGLLHYTKDLDLETFGSYLMFDLYYEKFKCNEINMNQLSIYTLAIFAVGEYDVKKIKEKYVDICAMPWEKVLPQGFFLLKKLLKGKASSMKHVTLYILELRRIKLLNSYRMRWLTNSRKRLIAKY